MPPPLARRTRRRLALRDRPAVRQSTDNPSLPSPPLHPAPGSRAVLTDLQDVFHRLNEAQVRYLVCGGLAVVAHGHLRVTHDLDLALAPDEVNLRAGLAALESLGFRPALPIPASDFADPVKRAFWQREKNMQVFSLVSAERRDLVIDLFCSLPFAFDPEWESAPEITLGPGFPPCRIVTLSTLRAMKRLAGRPIDLDDLEHLPSP